MRLKLVLISSLLAAVVGAGTTIAIILLVFASLRPITAPGLLVTSTYLLPMLPAQVAGGADGDHLFGAHDLVFRACFDHHCPSRTDSTARATTQRRVSLT
jgi:hypothetical protein